MDNNSDPNENDGKLFEMTLPAPPGNSPPFVSAGPDRTLTLPASAALDGAVLDERPDVLADRGDDGRLLGVGAGAQ